MKEIITNGNLFLKPISVRDACVVTTNGVLKKDGTAVMGAYDLNISYGDMLCFGFANMLLAILVFGILSLLMKWWSKNSSNSPF